MTDGTLNISRSQNRIGRGKEISELSNELSSLLELLFVNIVDYEKMLQQKQNTSYCFAKENGIKQHLLQEQKPIKRNWHRSKPSKSCIFKRGIVPFYFVFMLFELHGHHQETLYFSFESFKSVFRTKRIFYTTQHILCFKSIEHE